MVGTTGFEPATSRTPSVRATRLRYVPTGSHCDCCSPPLRGELQTSNVQPITRIREPSTMSGASRAGRAASCGLAASGATCACGADLSAMLLGASAPPLDPFRAVPAQRLIAQVAPRAGNRESFVVQQPLDDEDRIDVFTAIQPVPLGTLHRLEHGKLRLPIAQHKRLGRGQAADLADPEQVLGRNGRFGMSVALILPSLLNLARSATNPIPILARVNAPLNALQPVGVCARAATGKPPG